MEASGLPMTINITQDTHARIKGLFVTQYRGKFMVKNKGEMAMYLLERIKPELTADALGNLPNKEFMRIYRELEQGAG